MDNRTISALAIFLSGLCIFISSCNNHSKNDDRLSEDTFVSFYSEMLITGEMYRSDSTRYRSRLDSLRSAYNTTKEQVQRTVQWYASDNSRWTKMYEKVLARMETRVKDYEVKR